jgi:hypothetical protein
VGETPSGADQTPKAADEVDEENMESEGQYWATHLEYNIDDLMTDL